MKEKDFEVPKTVEQIQENTYDKKTKRTPQKKHLYQQEEKTNRYTKKQTLEVTG